MQIILGSSSPYRKQLLNKLKIDFSCASPDIDETPSPQETAPALVARLSQLKAQAVAKNYTNALVIGSDQVATLDGQIIGKSHNYANAVKQLQLLSGRAVTFYTGLCLLNSKTLAQQLEVVPFTVYFKDLSEREIKNYVESDEPFNCAGSFQSEGLGVALFEKMAGDDPNTLVGLPLMRLVAMLKEEGFFVL